ncbi:hypothetical protein HK102_006979, partial [Quaeritorhiza haematococci]
INRDQPLHEYYHKLLKSHRYGHTENNDTAADVKFSPKAINLPLTFRRTLRIRKMAKNIHSLCPWAGSLSSTSLNIVRKSTMIGL